MSSEEKEEPTSKKRVLGKIIGFGLLIGGVILVISGIIFMIRGNSMFGDPDAPWFETVSTGGGLLAGGFFMIFPAIFILVVLHQTKVMSEGKLITFGHDAEYDRYEKMIREGSKPRTTELNRLVEIAPDTGMIDDQIVKIRCQLCGALNDEDAKFCDQCSQPL